MKIRPNAAIQYAVLASLLAPALAGARSDPLDPTALVPPLTHSSVLSSAPALSETSVGSWRSANETVNRTGGWRAYARETQGAPVPDSAPPVAPNTTPATGGPAARTPAHRHP